MRTEPNIIVTGTPGVGKTTHCEVLAQNTGLKHLSINQIVKERGCHDGYDEEFKSWIVDEDKVRYYANAFCVCLGQRLSLCSCWMRLRLRWSRVAILLIGMRAICSRGAGLIWLLFYESTLHCYMIGWKRGEWFIALLTSPIKRRKSWPAMQRLPRS